MTSDTTEGGPVTVTIVTPCFNAAAHMRDCAESVLGQTYPDVEWVVVDGGSSDGTVDILREFEPRFHGRMRWTSEPDEGLYDAMNKGVQRASGDVIGILNSDDVFPPDAVERAVRTLAAQPGAGVVYGDTCNIDDEGRVTLQRPAPEQVTIDVMMAGMIVCHQSMFVTAETYRRVGTYDTRYRILADYEFLMRCLREGVTFANAGANLSMFRLGGVSGSSIRELDRERTLIRIAYGANPLIEWTRYYKHGLATVVYRLIRPLLPRRS